MRSESAFTMDTSSIKYGPGVTREIGHDMRQWGARRVMVVTDPYLAETEPVDRRARGPAAARGSTRCSSIRSASSRPTSRSRPPSRSPPTGRFDGYVAVGGGSSIDTAKAANLYATYPADFLTYVNRADRTGACRSPASSSP